VSLGAAGVAKLLGSIRTQRGNIHISITPRLCERVCSSKVPDEI
jgi:hypothetical protein